MNKLVEHIFVFEGEGKVKDFYGNYTEYRIEKEKQDRLKRKQERAFNQDLSKNTEIETVKKTSNKLSYKEKKEFEQLEIDIEQLENEKTELIHLMNSGTGSGIQLKDWSSRYGDVENDLDLKMMRWLELSEKE